MEKPPVTLDQVVCLGEVQQLRKTLEEFRQALEERITKTEVELGVLRAGCETMFHAMEMNGLLVGGEPAKVPGSNPGPEKSEKEPVSEETFTILNWDPQEGAKIGAYDVAYKASNVEENWTQAHNILRQSNSTIKSRYYGPGYVYSYWLYGEGKIYRQKLKPKGESKP